MYVFDFVPFVDVMRVKYKVKTITKIYIYIF